MPVSAQNLHVPSDGKYEQFKEIADSGIKGGQAILLNDDNEFVVIDKYNSKKARSTSTGGAYKQEYDSKLKEIGISKGLGGLKAAKTITKASLQSAMENRFESDKAMQSAMKKMEFDSKTPFMTTGLIKLGMKKGEDIDTKIIEARLKKEHFAELRHHDSEKAKRGKEMQAGIKLDPGT